MHCQSCLPSALTVAAPDPFGRISGVALVGFWSSVSIRIIIHNFLNVCHFDYTTVAVSGKVGYP